MEKQQIRDVLREVIKEHVELEGWTNLIKIGGPLKLKGVDFKALGYEKLFGLIRDHRDTFDWKVDKERNPGFFVVSVKEKSETAKKRFATLSQRPKASEDADGLREPSQALTQWASFGNWKEAISSLHSICLQERWHYKEVTPNNPFPILSSYLKYTFYRLTKEKGKILMEGNYAAFNTGLVDRRYEPIFALFTKTPAGVRPWRLINFCIAGEDDGKLLAKTFNPMPPRAHYFDRIADMLYDTLAPKPVCDWQHIIIENSDRLPYHFLEEVKPKGFELRHFDSLSYDEREDYYRNLSKSIVDDSKSYRNITNRFKDALELALKRIDWNFKTAIPTYFPRDNKMSLLLPLSLVDDEKVDISLVVEKAASGNYLGHTILPLDWAYSNARLVCRPDSDWLVATDIDQEFDVENIAE